MIEFSNNETMGGAETASPTSVQIPVRKAAVKNISNKQLAFAPLKHDYAKKCCLSKLPHGRGRLPVTEDHPTAY